MRKAAKWTAGETLPDESGLAEWLKAQPAEHVIIDNKKFDIRITDSKVPNLVHRVAGVFKEFGINMVHLEFARSEQTSRMFVRVEVLRSAAS